MAAPVDGHEDAPQIGMAGEDDAKQIELLALVPTYSKETPRLWGFPFFYWWQFLWIPLATLMTGTAYLIIKRARRDVRGDR